MKSISLHTRRHQIIAFIIACLLYILIAALLLLEYSSLLDHPFTPPSFHQTSIPLMPTPARKNSAPIRYVSPPPKPTSSPVAPPLPKKSAAQTATLPVTPTPIPKNVAPQTSKEISPQKIATPIKTTSPEKEKKKKTSEKKLPKVPQRHIYEPEHYHLQQMSPISNPSPSHLSKITEEEVSEENSYGRKQRSRNKWYKDGKSPEGQEGSHNYHPSQMAALADGFYQHMRKNYDKNLPMGIQGSENGSADPKAIEFGMFLYRFNHQLCDQSRMQPLPVHARLIKPHVIEIIVTVSRTRKVTNIKFPKPSYDEQLNDYVRDLLYAMISPQLPASYPEQEAILPIRIKIDRVYHQDKLWLYPVE
jgi:hypothetical protein